MGTKEIIAVVLIMIIVFAILSTAIILFVVVYNKTLRLHTANLKSKVLSAEILIYEKTTKEISREIHDSIGYDLNIASALLETDTDLQVNRNRIKIKLDEALGKLQNISRSLNAHHLEEFSLIETLHKEFDLFSKNSNIKFLLYCNHDTLPLKSVVQLNVFRICQEAISNSIKHGRASIIKIDISLNFLESIVLELHDNGNGTDMPFSLTSSNGLINMKERAEFINAELKFESNSLNGTTLKMIVPI